MEFAASSTPTIKAETKFMQNYRIASPVNAGSKQLAITDINGDMELFTIGTDGTIWNYYQDASSATGYSSASTGLNGTLLSGGRDYNGRLVVFTADSTNLQLQYVYEINQGATRWSDIKTVDMPQPVNPQNIAGIYTGEFDGQLYVAALTEMDAASPSECCYSLAWSQFDADSPSFTKASCVLNTLNCAWITNASAGVSFVCIDTVIMTYNISTGKAQNFPGIGLISSLSVDAADDRTGNSQIFSIGTDGNLYQFVQTSSGEWSWSQLCDTNGLSQVRVANDRDGGVQAFCLSKDNQIYHWKSDFSGPVPIYQNVVQFCVASYNGNDLDIFLNGTGQNTLFHMFQEAESTDWVVQSIEIQSNDVVEEYISYSTDIVLYDPAGAILPNEPVYIQTEEEACLDISGATYFFGLGRTVSVTTNWAGRLSIAQETGSLAVPAICLNVPRFMSSDQSISVDQSAYVQTKLTNVNGNDIMNAVDASGNNLLSNDYRTQANADSIAQVCNNCMELAGQLDTISEAAGLPVYNQGKRGVRICYGGSPKDLLRLRGNPPQKHWRLSFKGSEVLYREITAEDAQRLIREANLCYPPANGIIDWIADIGDLIEGVAEDIIDVVDCVVTTVGETVQAAITIVCDNVSRIFNTVIEFVEQAFDLVEVVWAEVEVSFTKLFEWLGFIFFWGDILRTRQAIKYTINQMLDFLSGAAAGVQPIIDSGIATLQTEVQSGFDSLISQIGTQTIGGCCNSTVQPDPRFEAGFSNNIVFNSFIDNVGNATPINGFAPAANSGLLDQLMQNLTQFAQDTENSQAFPAAKNYFTNLGSNPDQIFASTICDLLSGIEGVVQAVLAGSQAVADALLQVAGTLIDTLQTYLNETWNIPFVSQFYKWLTGDELSMADLIALIVAIPLTALYKIVCNEAPFPDDASVQAFEASFNAQSMLKAAGLSSGSRYMAQEGQESGGSNTKGVQMFMALGTVVSNSLYGMLTTCCDGQGEVQGAALAIPTVVFELSGQVFSSPWWGSILGDNELSTSEGWEKAIWVYGTMGTAIDILFIFLKKHIPENSDDIGVLVAFTLGVFHAAFAVLACLALVNEGIGSSQSAIDMASIITPVIPEVAKLLLLSEFVEASSGVTKAICCAIDAISYAASASIDFYRAVSDSNGVKALNPI